MDPLGAMVRLFTDLFARLLFKTLDRFKPDLDCWFRLILRPCSFSFFFTKVPPPQLVINTIVFVASSL